MSSLKVYLAAPYAARDTVRKHYVPDLERLGMLCVSSWLDEDHEINAGTLDAAADLDDATVSGHALDDLADVATCDVLVLLTTDYLNVGSASGGRHVETGYALALGARVIVVGEPENIFHRIQSGAVERVDRWQLALEALLQFQIRKLREALGAGR